LEPNLSAQALDQTFELRDATAQFRVDCAFPGMSRPRFPLAGHALQAGSRALSAWERPVAFDLLPLAGLAGKADVLLIVRAIHAGRRVHLDGMSSRFGG